MISISFYLLTPKAKQQSQLYVSISDKKNRLRFATNETFITNYCNLRKKKGRELVKKNTPFYFEYKSKMEEIRNQLIGIERELRPCTLTEIRDTYYLQIGLVKEEKKTFIDTFKTFMQESESEWSDNTKKNFIATFNHLKAFELTCGISENIETFWNSFRDYFVEKGFSNNSSNKYLKAVRQFLKYMKKNSLISFDLDELEYLEEIEPFKIALKEHEVEKLLSLDLSSESRLDKVRDLFILEILTGQRFSDLAKLLDAKYISATSISFYQHKTHEKVSIPLHPRLKGHLDYIFQKYPEGLPVISNQKFNLFLKEICQMAGFTKEHSWVTLSGKKRVTHTEFRYNLVSSHCARRTFCTLSLQQGINAELIMKISGHRSYDQFRAYIKIDDEDMENAFGGFMSLKNQ